MPFFAERRDNTRELNISGAQLLFALALGLAAGAPLVWVWVRHWLFAR